MTKLTSLAVAALCAAPTVAMIQPAQAGAAESHELAMQKATVEFKKYKARTLSSVEQDYLLCMKDLQKKGKELQ